TALGRGARRARPRSRGGLHPLRARGADDRRDRRLARHSAGHREHAPSPRARRIQANRDSDPSEDGVRREGQMSEPSRLRESSSSRAFERALLQSASLDREPEDGAARAIAALGITTTVGTTTGLLAASKSLSSGVLVRGAVGKVSFLALVVAGVIGAAAIV